jgi:hypothetical protein
MSSTTNVISDKHRCNCLSTTVTTQLPSSSSSSLIEIPWRDAQIRWSEEEDVAKTAIVNCSGNYDDDDDDDDDSDNNTFLDPFTDPDPTQLFTFIFYVTAAQKMDDAEESSSKSTTTKTKIDLKIQGYKTHSDPVWQSTGLTLWKAAKYLCDYMVHHSAELQGQRILEVRRGEKCTLEKKYMF